MKIHIIDHCCNISRSYIDCFKMINNIEFTDFDDADIICYIGCAYVKERIDNAIKEINELITKKNSNTKLAIFGCMTSYKDFYNLFKNRNTVAQKHDFPSLFFYDFHKRRNRHRRRL